MLIAGERGSIPAFFVNTVLAIVSDVTAVEFPDSVVFVVVDPVPLANLINLFKLRRRYCFAG